MNTFYLAVSKPNGENVERITIEAEDRETAIMAAQTDGWIVEAACELWRTKPVAKKKPTPPPPNPVGAMRKNARHRTNWIPVLMIWAGVVFPPFWFTGTAIGLVCQSYSNERVVCHSVSALLIFAMLLLVAFIPHDILANLG